MIRFSSSTGVHQIDRFGFNCSNLIILQRLAFPNQMSVCVVKCVRVSNGEVAGKTKALNPIILIILVHFSVSPNVLQLWQTHTHTHTYLRISKVEM